MVLTNYLSYNLNFNCYKMYIYISSSNLVETKIQ